MGLLRVNETNNLNEHNMVKNPNWLEANQLAIYKRDQGFELNNPLPLWDFSGLMKQII